MVDIVPCLGTKCPLKKKCMRWVENKPLSTSSIIMQTPYEKRKKRCVMFYPIEIKNAE